MVETIITVQNCVVSLCLTEVNIRKSLLCFAIIIF